MAPTASIFGAVGSFALTLHTLPGLAAGRRAKAAEAAQLVEGWPGFRAVAQSHLALVGQQPKRPVPSAELAFGHSSAGSAAPGVPSLAPGARGRTRLHVGTELQVEPLDPRPEGELIVVNARDGDNENYEVKIPPDWVGRFDIESIEKIEKQFFQEDDDLWSSEIFKAQLADLRESWVEFRVMETDSPQTLRIIHIGQRIAMLDKSGLAPQPHILPILENQVFDRSSFVLHPSVDMDLDMFLKARLAVQKWQKPKKPKTVPMNESLPILIDILHGLRSLELAGVMNFDLTPENVLLKGGRAYIAPLGRCCLLHDGDTGFGRGSFWDREGFLLGSSLNHAPEMLGGKITGPSDSVWAAGLIFGELALGAKPTIWFFNDGPGRELCDNMAIRRNQVPTEVLHRLDWDPPGRETIREAIYNDFRIEGMAGFDDAPEYVQEILSGLLAKRAKERWTAEYALERAMEAAEQAGINVPRPTPLNGDLAP